MKKEVAKQLVKFFDKKMKQLEGTENKLEPVPDNILKMIDDAKKVKGITKKYKVKLIINDLPVLAKKINADGCHLGQSDGSDRKSVV